MGNDFDKERLEHSFAELKKNAKEYEELGLNMEDMIAHAAHRELFNRLESAVTGWVKTKTKEELRHLSGFNAAMEKRANQVLQRTAPSPTVVDKPENPIATPISLEKKRNERRKKEDPRGNGGNK